jgi:DNA-binding transcriptional ArsR family regulator
MADLFSALADPDARTLLEALLDASDDGGPVPVAELAERLGILHEAVEARVTTLAAVGVLHRGGTEEERTISLDPRPLAEVDQWLAPFLERAAVHDADAVGEDEARDASGRAVFAAWAGGHLPESLRRARENLQSSDEVGVAVGRALRSTQARASGVAKKLKDRLQKDGE